MKRLNRLTVTVPFAFRTEGLLPRCRVTTVRQFRDTSTVGIRQATGEQAPVAFRYTRCDGAARELRWLGKRLWEPLVLSAVGAPDVHLTAAEMVARAERGEYNSNPLLVSVGCPSSIVRDAHWATWSEDAYRRLDETSRPQALERLKQAAEDVVVIDGMAWVAAGEPRYVVQTFGLGRNHGGTGLFVEAHYNDGIRSAAYFPADQLDKAVAAATEVAERREDKMSLPIKPSGSIEVLIAEAVRLKPARDHRVP